jgi:hypothetical protein
MICFPKRNTYRLGAIKDLLNIDPQQQTTGKLSTEGDHGGDQWKPHQHDAMYDVLTTYGVLQHCMKSSFHALVQDFPMAILDTSLFLDMQRLLNEKKTSNEDLLPFATRSKEYFTTSRPKGKKLGTLSKSFLQMLTNSLKADTRADDRIILIYEAAFLEPLDNVEIVPSLSKTKEESGKGKDCGSPKQEEAGFLVPLNNVQITPSLSTAKEDSGKVKDCGSPKQKETAFLGPLNNVQITPSLSTAKEDSGKVKVCGSPKQKEAGFFEPLDNVQSTPSLSTAKEDSGKVKDCGSPKQKEAGFFEPLDNVQVTPSLSTTKEDSEKERDGGSLKQEEDYLTCSTQKRPKLSLE